MRSAGLTPRGADLHDAQCRPPRHAAPRIPPPRAVQSPPLSGDRSVPDRDQKRTESARANQPFPPPDAARASSASGPDPIRPGAVPPVAARIPKTDVVHGETRVDDYFWMREKTRPEVAA